MEQIFCSILSSDFYGNVLSASICRGFHDLANSLCDSSVAADNHAGISISNSERQLNIVAINHFFNVNSIGFVNDSACYVGKYFLKIHYEIPIPIN